MDFFFGWSEPRRYKHVTSPAVAAATNRSDKRQSAAVQSGSALQVFYGELEKRERKKKNQNKPKRSESVLVGCSLQGSPQSIDSPKGKVQAL